MNRHLTSAGLAVAELAERHADDGRLSRGRTLFRKGSVTSLTVLEGSILATVRGSGGDEYEVSIGTASPSKRVVREVAEAQERDPTDGAADGSSRLVDRLVNDGVEICPPERDVGYSCDCPDWDELCKHVVAVLFAFADRVDLDETELLRWRGLDQPDRSRGRTETDPDPETETDPDFDGSGDGVGDRASRRAAARDKKRSELHALLGHTAVRMSPDGDLETSPPDLDGTWVEFLGRDLEITPVDLALIAESSDEPDPLFADSAVGVLATLGPALAEAITIIGARLAPVEPE